MNSLTMPLVLTISAFALSVFTSGQPLPERIWYVHVRPLPPPETLEGRVNEADLVVRGRIGSAEGTQADESSADHPVILTTYSVDVLEVVRRDWRLPESSTQITVTRRGGTLNTGKEVLRSVTRGFPDLSIGEEYVLFLDWWPEQRAYHVLWEADGMFELSSGIVKPRGGSAVSRETQFMAREQFLIRLRTAAKQ